MRKNSILTFLVVALVTTVVMSLPGYSAGPEVLQAARFSPANSVLGPPLPPLEPVEITSAAPAGSTEVAIAPPPEHFTGPAPVRVAPPSQLRAAPTAKPSTLQGGTWAVVIGINDYPGTSNDLNYSLNDAGDTVQALQQQGVEPGHILFLRDGQVTAKVVHDATNWLTSHAGPDAVAVFFYSGHVAKRGSAEAIITSDGGRVFDSELASWLRPLQAKRAWITIAACYGGGFTEVLAPGRVLTAAAKEDEVAYETSAFGRSYLGEYMIRRAMVEGAANDTVQTAFRWAYDHLAAEYPDRVPVQYDYGDGHLDLRPFIGATQASYSPPPSSDEPAAQQPPDSGGAQDPAPPPEPTPTPPRCTGSIIKLC